jgi:hypothetical protein
MSGLRSDMSGLGRICPFTGNFTQRKSRSRDKTMRLGSDELAISKLDNLGTTRSNLDSRIQI